MPALRDDYSTDKMNSLKESSGHMHNQEWGEFLPEEIKTNKETEEEAFKRRQREEEQRRKENEPPPLTARELEELDREEQRRREASDEHYRNEKSRQEADKIREAQKESAAARAEYERAQEAAIDEKLKKLIEIAFSGLGDRMADERRAQRERDADPKVRAEREKQRREMQDQAWREEDRREREVLKAAEKEYQALKAERAPREAVSSLMAAKTELDLGEGVSVDLGTAIPRLVEELRNNPDGAPAAEALESGLKALEKVATDALMYGGDYAASLDALAESLKQKAFSESRRHKLDLAALGAPAPAMESAPAKETPRNELEAALSDSGVTIQDVETAIASMPDGGLISERRMFENTLKSIKQKIASGISAKDDEGFRGEMGLFVDQMKRIAGKK